MKLLAQELRYIGIYKLFFALSLSLITGCASYHGAAKITSNPPGAQVINVDTGEVLGTTPLLLDWKERVGTRQQILIKLVKEGYYQKTEGFWVNMDSKSAKKAEKMPNLVEIPMRKIGE